MGTDGTDLPSSIERLTMRQFSFDNDDQEDDQDLDEFFSEMEFEVPAADYEHMMQHHMTMQQAQIGIAHREMDLRLLVETMRMCESTAFWKWKSPAKRKAIIESTYEAMLLLLNLKEEDEE